MENQVHAMYSKWQSRPGAYIITMTIVVIIIIIIIIKTKFHILILIITIVKETLFFSLLSLEVLFEWHGIEGQNHPGRHLDIDIIHSHLRERRWWTWLSCWINWVVIAVIAYTISTYIVKYPYNYGHTCVHTLSWCPRTFWLRKSGLKIRPYSQTMQANKPLWRGIGCLLIEVQYLYIGIHVYTKTCLYSTNLCLYSMSVYIPTNNSILDGTKTSIKIMCTYTVRWNYIIFDISLYIYNINIYIYI